MPLPGSIHDILATLPRQIRERGGGNPMAGEKPLQLTPKSLAQYISHIARRGPVEEDPVMRTLGIQAGQRGSNVTTMPDDIMAQGYNEANIRGDNFLPEDKYDPVRATHAIMDLLKFPIGMSRDQYKQELMQLPDDTINQILTHYEAPPINSPEDKNKMIDSIASIFEGAR